MCWVFAPAGRCRRSEPLQKKHAIRILDLYHAKVHLRDAAKAIYGAGTIIALRCCKPSRRFEDFWERRSAAAVAAG